jgi:hypothetical protein
MLELFSQSPCPVVYLRRVRGESLRFWTHAPRMGWHESTHGNGASRAADQPWQPIGNARWRDDRSLAAISAQQVSAGDGSTT